MKRAWGTVAAAFLCLWPVTSAARGRVPTPNRPPRATEAVKTFESRSFEDDHGGFYTVYTHAVSSDTLPSLAIQHIDSQGAPTWPAPIVIGGHIDSADGWDAFADGQGGGIATWIRGGALFARHFDPQGTISWSDVLALSLSTGTVTSPTGVADEAGGAYIVWSQELYPKRSVLLEQHLNATGQALWKLPDMRVSLRPSRQERPSIVTDGQGGAFIVWNDFLDQSSQVQLQRNDPIGDRLFGPQGIVVTAPASLDKEPLTLEPLFTQGHVVFQWTGSQSAMNRVFLQRVDSHGAKLWSPQGISVSMGSANQWNPTVYGDDNGSLWVAWVSNADNGRWKGYLAHLDPQGQPLFRPEPISDTDADQGNFAITGDGAGGVFAAWFDNRTGTSGLYYQAMDSLGKRRLPSQGLSLITGLTDPYWPTLVPISAGHAAVVWANRIHPSLWGIYWSVVDNHTY